MYLMTKAGFFEIDANDGTLDAKTANGKPAEIVVRARRQEDIVAFVDRYTEMEPYGENVIHATPQWDYQYRVFLTRAELAEVMLSVAAEIDYRNFKNYCRKMMPRNEHLAHEIWGASFDDAGRV